MAKTARLINAGQYMTRGDANSNLARDRRMVNYVRRADPESGKIYYEKRQGWNSTDSVLSGTTSTWAYGRCFMKNAEYGGRALIFGNGQIFASGISEIDVLYASTSLGQITQAAPIIKSVFLTEAVTSGGSHHLITIENVVVITGAVQQSLMYYFTPTSITASGALTQVTDADLPTYFRGPATQKWGFVFIHGNNGSVYNLDLNSVSSITGGNYFPCDAIPDNGYGVWENGPDMLAAFGAKHIELLVNSGRQTLSPLLRADGGVIEIGVESSKGIISAGGTLYFIGTPRGTTSRALYSLRGAQVAKLSTPGIDAIMQTRGISVQEMSIVPMFGEPTLLVGLYAAATFFALACRLSDGYWYEWALSASDPIWPVGPSKNTTAASGAAECISGTNTTRYMYTSGDDTPSHDDNGQTFTGTIQSARTDFGSGDTKTINWLELIGDTAGSGDAHVVSISTDDAATWTAAGTIDMSTRDRRLHGLGSCVDLAIKIEHSTATASRLEAVDANIEKWAH